MSAGLFYTPDKKHMQAAGLWGISKHNTRLCGSPYSRYDRSSRATTTPQTFLIKLQEVPWKSSEALSMIRYPARFGSTSAASLLGRSEILYASACNSSGGNAVHSALVKIGRLDLLNATIISMVSLSDAAICSRGSGCLSHTTHKPK